MNNPAKLVQRSPAPSDPAAAHTLHERLRKMFPAAKNATLKQMVVDGRVSVNGRQATKLSQCTASWEVVRVDDPGKRRAAQRKPTLSPLKLIYEDQDVLVIEKPPGLLTSTVPRERRPTALAIVRRYALATAPRARVGLIHRLDRDAGGLLVFSKSDVAYQSLKTQFFRHSVDRVYEAIVRGSPNPKKGRIETRLVERGDGTVHSTDLHAAGERAISEYEVIGEEQGLATVRVTLLSGRKHQIRVHLSERGWPIVGDTVYGGGNDPGGLRLRAVRLVFDHPRTGARQVFELLQSKLHTDAHSV